MSQDAVDLSIEVVRDEDLAFLDLPLGYRGEDESLPSPDVTLREIDLGHATVKALRLGYVGELGWELYMPTEFMPQATKKFLIPGASPRR